MSVHMRTQTIGESTEINIIVSNWQADSLCKALSALLDVARQAEARVPEDDKLYTVDEVLPENNPGLRLRGLRTMEGLTQKQLAQTLNIKQHHVSEMERGIRPISVPMARKIAKAYGISYKTFI